MSSKSDSTNVAARPTPKRIPFFRQLIDHASITPEVEAWDYAGSGTDADPYVVTWIENDPRNPMLYPALWKWGMTLLVGFVTLAVSFVSAAYTGGGPAIIAEFNCSEVEFVLGLSLFVLGFAIGPLLWAPLSELYGRQILFSTTYLGLTIFNAGAAGAQNIATLVVLRFLAGAVGSAPLTNAGGVLADMFNAKQRGMAMCVWAAAPFMGPVIGPIVGGFVGETIGWRWIEGIMAIFTGVLWIAGTLLLPETYPPVLLRARARELSKRTGLIYRSQGEINQGPRKASQVFGTALLRPWVILFREPIVLLLSLYMAVIYGTLYMLFGAFPIVFQQGRGWSPGIGGLAFLGVLVGMALAVAYCLWDNKRYGVISDKHAGFAPPEQRLPSVMLGGALIPVGLFWFAWTNGPEIHWIVPIIAGGPFGFGMVLVFLGMLETFGDGDDAQDLANVHLPGLMNYLIDSYTLYAASCLAANSILRSLFGTVFPLFTPIMYQRLGIHWASSVPAFLALACVPFPFLFYHYGPAIRARCKFAAEAAAFLRKMQETNSQPGQSEKSRVVPDGRSSTASTSDLPEHAEDYTLDEDSKGNKVHDA